MYLKGFEAEGLINTGRGGRKRSLAETGLRVQKVPAKGPGKGADWLTRPPQRAART